MKSQRLPDAEFEIMECIWEAEPPVTTGLVMERVGKSRGWKIQSVVTLMARLTERGFLRVEKGAGRERSFYPLISRAEYLQMETDSFVSRYHNSSVVSLIHTLRKDQLSPEDLDELSAWVKQAKERGK